MYIARRLLRRHHRTEKDRRLWKSFSMRETHHAPSFRIRRFHSRNNPNDIDNNSREATNIDIRSYRSCVDPCIAKKRIGRVALARVVTIEVDEAARSRCLDQREWQFPFRCLRNLRWRARLLHL